MPWEIYRPSVRMCEAKTDNSAQPPALRGERGSTQASMEKPAPKVAVRQRGSRRPSVEKPARRKVVVRELVNEVGREKEVVPKRDPERMSTIPWPEPKAQGSLNPLPRWKPYW
jgi:hypothetical protein